MIPKRAMRRLIKEISNAVSPGLLLRTQAFEALHHAAEAYLIEWVHAEIAKSPNGQKYSFLSQWNSILIVFNSVTVYFKLCTIFHYNSRNLHISMTCQCLWSCRMQIHQCKCCYKSNFSVDKLFFISIGSRCLASGAETSIHCQKPNWNQLILESDWS